MEVSNSKASSKKRVNGIKKGKQFEREIANALGHIFPEAQRMLEYQASNVIGVDIEGTWPFLFQCKNHQTYTPVSTIKEIRTQSKDDIPVLITKGIRMETMAILPFEKFVTLLEVAYGLSPLLQQAHTTRHLETAVKHGPVLLSDEQWEVVESPFNPQLLEVDMENSLSDFI